MACLVFDHIPKTGGTTFKKSYLKMALPSPARWILSGGANNEHDRQRFLDLPAEQRQAIRVVAGHYVETLRPHLPEARFTTVIRDPLSRTISAYLHALHHPGADALWPDVRREQLSLGEYVARYYSVVADYQSKAVLGLDYASLDDEAIRKQLDERYVLVGYTEALDSFVFLLHAQEGLPLALYKNRLVRSERASYVPSADDIAAVRACTATDARLHRIVRERCDAALTALPSELQGGRRKFLTALQEFRAQAEDPVDRSR